MNINDVLNKTRNGIVLTKEEILLLTKLRDDILAIIEEKTNKSK